MEPTVLEREIERFKAKELLRLKNEKEKEEKAKAKEEARLKKIKDLEELQKDWNDKKRKEKEQRLNEAEIEKQKKVLKREEDKKNKLKEKEKAKEELEKENTEIYCKLKKEFELKHAKIIYDSLFVLETDNKVIIMKKENLITSYEHLECGIDKNGNKILFIFKWLNDETIRKYNDMDIYPKPELCPETTYNLWRPFAMELLKDIPYTPNITGRDFILNHIRFMCNNEEHIYEYVVKWNAQMFQYPEKKTIAPTFTGEEGTGKTSIIELNKRLMGKDKVLETTKPSQYVFGDFNGLMQYAFLVHISEAEKADSKTFNGQFKALIKDSTLLINHKGKGHITVNSYHRFISCSNNADSVMTKKGDRRNLVISVSDEKKGDSEYFDEFYKYINDTDTLRTLYDYFMAMKDLENFDKEPLPITEHQALLQESARTIPDMWLEEFTQDNIDEPEVIMTGKECYELFMEWKGNNNIVYDANSIKLGVQLSMLKIKDAITLKPNKRDKVFNIAVLRKHYNI